MNISALKYHRSGIVKFKRVGLKFLFLQCSVRGVAILEFGNLISSQNVNLIQHICTDVFGPLPATKGNVPS